MVNFVEPINFSICRNKPVYKGLNCCYLKKLDAKAWWCWVVIWGKLLTF